MPKHTSNRFILLILVLISPLGGIGVDLYVPSLPSIARFYHTQQHMVGMTISYYLLGYACGQPFFGPLSESYGRKKLLAFGLSLYTLSSLLAAFVPTVHGLIALRLVQGISVTAIVVNLRAMVTDIFTDKLALAKAFTAIVMAWSVGPIIAPAIGGYLQAFWGWQSCFIFLAGFSMLLLLLTLAGLPETNREPTPLSLSHTLTSYKQIIRNPSFLAIASCLGIAYSLIIIFNVTSPFIIQVLLHFSAIDYGHIALVMGLGNLLGSMCNRYLITRCSTYQICLVATFVIFLAALCMLVSYFTFETTLMGLLVPVFVMLMCVGAIYSNCSADCMGMFPGKAGFASAIMGTVTLTITAISSAFAAYLKTSSLLAISVMYLIVSLLLLLLYPCYLRKQTA